MLKKLEKIRSFLHELQRSDRVRKKRWLFGLTATAMILVIILWAVYINNVGLPALESSSASKQQIKKTEENNLSTWEIFQRGLKEIFSDAKKQFEMSKKMIEEQIQKTNEITIDATSTATSTNNE